MAAWRSDEEIERLHRIQVAAWAWAYEVESDPIVEDAEFDRVCRLIRPAMSTGRPDLDAFFRTQFNPSTGMWVHHHPEKHKLARVCRAMRRRKAERIAYVQKEEAKPAPSQVGEQLGLF